MIDDCAVIILLVHWDFASTFIQNILLYETITIADKKQLDFNHMFTVWLKINIILGPLFYKF